MCHLFILSIFTFSCIFITLFRHLFPAITSALFTISTKPDVRVSAGEALKALQALALSGHTSQQREKLWCWVTDYKHQEEIKRVTGIS